MSRSEQPGTDDDVKTRPRETGDRSLPRDEKPGVDDVADEADVQDDEAGADEQHPEDADAESRKKRRPTVLIVAIVVVLSLALGGIYYWLSTRNIEDTDDAYTDGYAVQIAPQVAGRVVSLDITDNQFVRKGQALIHIDPRQFINDRDQSQGQLDTAKAQLSQLKLAAEVAAKNFPAALQVAQANLAAAKASLVQRQADFARQKSLPRQATTQQDIDSATSNLENAQAQVLLMQARVVQAEPVKQQIGETEKQVSQQQGQLEQAQSRLNQANLNLSYTVVKAPQDGWVTRRQGVKIAVDAFPDLDLRGHVDSIQLGSGSRFSAFPAENATGNFVKIVQRVPVKIIIDSGLDPTLPLPLGISVDPKVTVR